MPTSWTRRRPAPRDLLKDDYMPWHGWAYLALLCLVGAGGFVAGARARRVRLACLQLAAIAVLAWGVALYFRGHGAGIAYGLALLCAIAVLALKDSADRRADAATPVAPATRLALAFGQLLLVPAAVLGALAFWSQRGG